MFFLLILDEKLKFIFILIILLNQCTPVYVLVFFSRISEAFAYEFPHNEGFLCTICMLQDKISNSVVPVLR